MGASAPFFFFICVNAGMTCTSLFPGMQTADCTVPHTYNILRENVYTHILHTYMHVNIILEQMCVTTNTKDTRTQSYDYLFLFCWIIENDVLLSIKEPYFLFVTPIRALFQARHPGMITLTFGRTFPVAWALPSNHNSNVALGNLQC